MSALAPGPQLPPNSTGDITGAFPLTVNGESIVVPATIIVDASGNEAVATRLASMRESLNVVALQSIIDAEELTCLT